MMTIKIEYNNWCVRHAYHGSDAHTSCCIQFYSHHLIIMYFMFRIDQEDDTHNVVPKIRQLNNSMGFAPPHRCPTNNSSFISISYHHQSIFNLVLMSKGMEMMLPAIQISSIRNLWQKASLVQRWKK